MPPETTYVRSGEYNIACQVVGGGPFDLVYVPGWVSNIELRWEQPGQAHFLQRLGSFSRLIIFDKRGTGLSDRVPNSALPTLEQRMDDVRVVMDAAGSKRAAIFAVSEGGAMALQFAATYPERTIALILYGGFAKRLWSSDYPWGPTRAERQKFFDEIEREWGRVSESLRNDPLLAGNAELQEWWARYYRQSASPSAALALAKMNTEIDVRAVLPTIHVPTLLLHHIGDTDAAIGGARFMAQQIPGARLIELTGPYHVTFEIETDQILNEIEEFLTGVRHAPEPDRVLATVMFTDIVGSTERVAELGDRHWRDLLDKHDMLLRDKITRFRGRAIKSTGDGIFAAFDGPGRAIRCACSASDAMRQLGIEIRTGLHTGECELMGDDVGGIAVHIGARVMAKAGGSEVLVSSTVKDLVAGSGIQFVDRGMYALKGVPGEWHLYAVDRQNSRLTS